MEEFSVIEHLTPPLRFPSRRLDRARLVRRRRVWRVDLVPFNLAPLNVAAARIEQQRVLDDGTNLNRNLLAAGLAWHFKRYNDDPELAELEDEARKASRGIWADPNPIPPWDWRQNERESRREETASQRDAA